jgi:hypothetical protein
MSSINIEKISKIPVLERVAPVSVAIIKTRILRCLYFLSMKSATPNQTFFQDISSRFR